jgi:hypothetical protein
MKRHYNLTPKYVVIKLIFKNGRMEEWKNGRMENRRL